jgi:hypothetical protein
MSGASVAVLAYHTTVAASTVQVGWRVREAGEREGKDCYGCEGLRCLSRVSGAGVHRLVSCRSNESSLHSHTHSFTPHSAQSGLLLSHNVLPATSFCCAAAVG